MSNQVSMGQMEIAVARKQLDSIEQQGKDAVKLIEATAPPPVEGAPPANAAAGVGTQINYTA